jgi:hypothetical protein
VRVEPSSSDGAKDRLFINCDEAERKLRSLGYVQ